MAALRRINMFAVVSYKGNQYKFTPGKEYSIDLIEAEEGAKEIIFSDVLLLSDDKKVEVGTPTVKGISVTAEILGDVAGEKVRVFKFHAKKHYKRTLGQRPDYTRIKVLEVKKNEK